MKYLMKEVRISNFLAALDAIKCLFEQYHFLVNISVIRKGESPKKTHYQSLCLGMKSTEQCWFQYLPQPSGAPISNLADPGHLSMNIVDRRARTNAYGKLCFPYLNVAMKSFLSSDQEAEKCRLLQSCVPVDVSCRV